MAELEDEFNIAEPPDGPLYEGETEGGLPNGLSLIHI